MATRHHVAQRARAVIVLAPAFDADILGDRDLYVVDVVAVPERLEQHVGKAQRREVLHGLLAEVVIDAEDLPLLEDRSDLVVNRPRRREIVADRLLQHHARVGCHQPGGAQAYTGLAEQLRRGREVKHPDAVAVVELGHQLAPALGFRGICGDIVEPVEKARQAALVDILGCNIAAQVLLDLRDVAVTPEVAARDADDPALGRELPVAIAVVQAGQQLASGKVAGGPEHREVEGIDRYDLCRQDVSL